MSIIVTNALQVANLAGGFFTAAAFFLLFNGLTLYCILDDAGNELPVEQCLNCADYVPLASNGD